MTDPGVSLERLKERLEREPCAGAMHLLAETYYQQGLFPQAVEASRRALALSPDNPELQLLLGQSLFPLGEFAEAEEVLKLVVREIGRLAEVFETLRQLYAGQGRGPEADQAAELYRLLQGPLGQLLAGKEIPREANRQRLLATRTLDVLEKWQGALQSR